MDCLHLLATRSGRETEVAKRAKAVGARTYVPKTLEYAADGNEERVLYPGYVFVWVFDQWRKLCHIPGVYDFVRLGGLPAPVHERVISELRQHENPFGFIVFGSRFHIGQSVRVCEGGALGLVQGFGPRQGVRLLLNVLGRKIELTMPERDLIAA